MKNYYDLFITYSMSLCSHEDYSNKERVKEHNASMKKLLQLQLEMDKELESFSDIMSQLLVHNNEKVCINAAEYCLNRNIHEDKAICTLNNIAKFSSDLSLRFAARMILQKAQTNQTNHTTHKTGDGSLSSDELS